MKRFTETTKWQQEWYQDLSPRLKCLWQYMCDNADAAGVWEPNFRLASFQIGEQVTEADLQSFGERVRRLDSGKVHLPSFIGFQYGKLSETCKPHAPVLRALEKHGLSEGCAKGIDTLKDTHTEKDKEEETEKPKPSDTSDASAPTAEDVVKFGTRDGIPEDYCRTYHAKRTENQEWFKSGRLILWRQQMPRYWAKDRATWGRAPANGSGGYKKARITDVNHPDFSPL